MKTILGQSSTREELEQKFLTEHASFARAWALSREGRTTSWVSPGGTLRIHVTLAPFEYREPGCVAGLLGESLVWDETLLKRSGDGWTPAAVHVGPRKAKKKHVRRSA